MNHHERLIMKVRDGRKNPPKLGYPQGWRHPKELAGSISQMLKATDIKHGPALEFGLGVQYRRWAQVLSASDPKLSTVAGICDLFGAPWSCLWTPQEQARQRALESAYQDHPWSHDFPLSQAGDVVTISGHNEGGIVQGKIIGNYGDNYATGGGGSAFKAEIARLKAVVDGKDREIEAKERENEAQRQQIERLWAMVDKLQGGMI